MTNLVFLVLMTVGSVLGGPALKVVTELVAKGVVEQDEGITRPARPRPSALASTSQAEISQPGASQIGASVAVLAMASTVPAVAPPSATTAEPAEAAEAAAILARVVGTSTVAITTAGRADAEPVPSETLLALIGDPPRRRPDASVFMPVTLQRVVGLRTEITRVEQFAATQEIAGRIVTSRNVSGLIQANQPGVIAAVDGNLPRVGDRVENGQVLAHLRPIIDAARKVEVDAKIEELRGLMSIGEQRIDRLREVLFIRYRQSKIDAVEAEIENYRRQLRIYTGLKDERMEVRALSAGVISRVNFVAGQSVDAHATLFEIVDPRKLWVEAASFDPELASSIAAAAAITGDGQTLRLRFTGGGLMLQNQALPLQFDILDPGTNLQIGKPVTVIIQRQRGLAAGIRVPVSAVLQGTTGETLVWERVSAEVFRTRPVSVMPLDGRNMVVTSGLAPNMRVVTAASAMLAQVR